MTDGTIGYYNEHAMEYCDSTFGIDMENEWGLFLSRVPQGSRILDLGCGSCRDTVHFRSLGYETVPADASEGMRLAVKERLGIDILPLDVEKMDLSGFDAVWACASLLHLRSDCLPDVLSRIKGSMRSQGVLYCSFKYGDFEGERDGRWYTDLTAAGLDELLLESGFQPMELWTSVDDRGTLWSNAVSVSVR